MVKVNKYESGAASIEIVSNKYLKISCTQSNEIILGAKAVCTGGTICMFDALPIAFASTDGVEIYLKASSEVDISKTSYSHTKKKGTIKALAVSSCKAQVRDCRQSIRTVTQNANAFTAAYMAYGKSSILVQRMEEVNNTRQLVSDKMKITQQKQSKTERQKTSLTQKARKQIDHMNKTIAQLKEVENQLKEIIKQRSAVVTSNNEQGGSFSLSSGISNM
ncbi:MAG: hypothetical protein Q3990_04460 [Desulfovibrionaceae bacterium]|nr:hypothetical protein [Desulfovibrionaceae bacterium]